jgi:hypothetical protein
VKWEREVDFTVGPQVMRGPGGAGSEREESRVMGVCGLASEASLTRKCRVPHALLPSEQNMAGIVKSLEKSLETGSLEKIAETMNLVCVPGRSEWGFGLGGE